MTVTNFQGLTVLTIESRRGQEMGRLIATYGGKPFHAPAMREVPLSSNIEARKFADALMGVIAAIRAQHALQSRLLPPSAVRPLA